MPRHASNQPTDVELQILRILWELGPSTARQIHVRLNELKGTQYPTTVKMLLVMLEKGLVKRDDSVRPQIYTSASSQTVTQKRMLKELIRKVYDGSAKSLVMQALTASRATKAELDEIRQLIEDMGATEDSG